MDLDAAGDALRAGPWPGVVAAAGVGPDTAGTWVLGDAAPRRPMAPDTVFDLDALTEVLATAPAVLLLADRGVVELDDPACLWVATADPRITVRQLLTHTAGLPGGADLRAGVSSPADLVARAAAVAPGGPPAYSALGFVVLGGLVEAATGHGLDEVVREWLLERLGCGARFRLPGAWRERYAAVGAVTGRVHDPNAAAAHGATGHAGLFGTLADVRACLPLWWSGGPLLGDRIRAEALAAPFGWTAQGTLPGWGPRTVHHAGATGTGLALDPDTRRWAVVLANAPGGADAVRAFHAAVGDG